MCPLLSLDSHNVIYCCKFSCSDWFFCTFPIKHFLVSDLPWSMVSALELELIFSGVFSLVFCFFGFFFLPAHPWCSIQLPAVLPVSDVFLEGRLGQGECDGRSGFCKHLTQAGVASSPISQPCCGVFLVYLEDSQGLALVSTLLVW